MGEFSYTQPDDLSGYGQQEYPEPGIATGYDEGNAGFAPEYDYQAGGYQEEMAALIPQDVPLLGAILIEQGVLTPEALQEAIAKQLETGSSLAQILLDAGWAAPDQLVQALQIRASYGAAA